MRREYRAAADPADPAADVAREHMDRVLAEILRDRQALIPFEERYSELEKVKYRK